MCRIESGPPWGSRSQWVYRAPGRGVRSCGEVADVGVVAELQVEDPCSGSLKKERTPYWETLMPMGPLWSEHL